LKILVLSPGPGLPKDAGDMNKLIKAHIDSIPILGVCLGFQAIIEHFGGEIYNQNEVKHGVAESCNFDSNSKLFAGLPSNFNIGLYHSWAAVKNNFPSHLSISAESENGIIMGFEHTTLPVCGVQFHPESILTENGKAIVQNFIGNFN
jgi:anthranilate synthase component 2